jgi:hypothetical protein
LKNSGNIVMTSNSSIFYLLMSLVQSPQTFRQIYFDSPLLHVDLLQVRLREWDQRFFVFEIDFQNLGAAWIQHVGDDSKVLTIHGKDLAPFQLKRVKPAFFRRRQIHGWDADFTANPRFRFRNRIDPAKFYYATSVLPAKKLNLPFVLGECTGKEFDLTSGLKNPIVFEHLLDSDLAFQSLGFDDPGDRYVGRFLMLMNEALLQNLKCEPLFQLHARGAENSTDWSCRSTLLAYDFSEVALGNSKLENGRLLSFDWSHGYLVGIIHKSFRNLLDELLHSHLHVAV